MLQSLLTSLEPPVQEAAQMLPQTAGLDEIAALAVRCNVFHTMRSLLKFSDLLREKVSRGTLQIHGAIYDITTGRVELQLLPFYTQQEADEFKSSEKARETSVRHYNKDKV